MTSPQPAPARAIVLYGRASFDHGQNLKALAASLADLHTARDATVTVRTAYADLSGPALPAVLADLERAGATEALVIPSMVPADPSLSAWLPGALSHWAGTQGSRMTVRLAPPVESALDLPAALDRIAAGPAEALADVRETDPSLGKPGWSTIPEHGRQLFVCVGARCLHRGADALDQRPRETPQGHPAPNAGPPRGPLAGAGGGRRGRTGRRGRWTADGQLILCGRIDHQVKLHGQRVELAEIEQDLLAHPAAAQAVVLVDAAAEGTKALRAFVRAKDGATLPDEETWRAFLADRLPAFMVPASVTAVNSVPLTPAGKIDRDALLRLAHAHWDTTTAERQAPRDGLEQRIAALWGGLLGEKVARTDNFFALGGNSLLAVTIAHRLSQELGVAVPARTLFAAPTLAGFARKVAELRDAETPQADTDESDLATEGEREFRVAEAAGLDTRPFIIPVIRAVEGELPDEARWADAWTALAERHEALRTTFAEDTEGRLRRHIAPTIDVTPELSKQPDRAAALAHIRARQGQPFAMATAPLWRAGLVTLADGGAPLFWMAMHHSIGDGRSVGILLEELTALLAGKTLSPLPARYAAMAARERRYLESPDRATDEAHWQEQLSALPAESFDDWPLDTPRAAGAAPGSHRFELRLEPSTAAGLKAVARRPEASLPAGLLTSLARGVRGGPGRNAVAPGRAGA
ncbi:hypothetical protein GAY28_31555, partial [Azospirillum brasilense]|nr:hypothetical protein [Azospirillum brasilense]